MLSAGTELFFLFKSFSPLWDLKAIKYLHLHFCGTRKHGWNQIVFTASGRKKPLDTISLGVPSEHMKQRCTSLSENMTQVCLYSANRVEHEQPSQSVT